MTGSGTADFAYGARTLALVERVAASGVRRMSLLMRHSAREYAPGRHDLANPLTEEGRRLARDLGARLPADWVLRAYASPAPRCMDTAELVHAAHLEVGGRGTGSCRPVEALGVFYVLDQMRMFKILSMGGDGLQGFVSAWLDGGIPADVVMAAPDTVRTLQALLVTRMLDQRAAPGLDLCVSHDLTLYVMRAVLLGLQPTAEDPVRYLDGILFFEEGGTLKVATHDHEPVTLASPATT
jgi:broad specificity phosphatase PhoE